MEDDEGNILYIGKAKNLSKRVINYTNLNNRHRQTDTDRPTQSDKPAQRQTDTNRHFNTEI